MSSTESRRTTQNESIFRFRRFLNLFANRLAKFLHALVKRGGNRQHLHFFDFRFELLQIFLGDGFVHFVGDDEARFFEQRGIVKFQFAQQLLVIVPRLAVVRAGHVEQQHEDFAALDVAQKFVAEADVVVRAFDQARHVADREPFPVGIFDDADLRMQRGERIRRDFRARAGNGREQSGLARVRITDQADFRDDAQFQKKIAFVARLARLRETRRLARGGGEIAIAQSAASAFAQNKLLPVLREVGDEFAFG